MEQNREPRSTHAFTVNWFLIKCPMILDGKRIVSHDEDIQIKSEITDITEK